MTDSAARIEHVDRLLNDQGTWQISRKIAADGKESFIVEQRQPLGWKQVGEYGTIAEVERYIMSKVWVPKR